MSVIVRIYTTC